jgi:hypothetical protein
MTYVGYARARGGSERPALGPRNPKKILALAREFFAFWEEWHAELVEAEDLHDEVLARASLGMDDISRVQAGTAVQAPVCRGERLIA